MADDDRADLVRDGEHWDAFESALFFAPSPTMGSPRALTAPSHVGPEASPHHHDDSGTHSDVHGDALNPHSDDHSDASSNP